MRPTSLKTLFSGAVLACTLIGGACYAEEARTVVAAAPTTAQGPVSIVPAVADDVEDDVGDGSATLVNTATMARRDPGETLEAINTTYRALYRQRTQQVLESLPLVLVVQNNMVTAVRGHHRKLYAVPIQ